MNHCRVQLLVLLCVACSVPSLAADEDDEIDRAAPGHEVVLSTPPVWFFDPRLEPGDGTATCLAVNVHRHAVELTIELIFHDDDDLGPALPPPFFFDEWRPVRSEPQTRLNVTGLLAPGEAMVVSDAQRPRHPQGAIGRTHDSFLARCVFTYRGDPRKIKASIVLEGGLSPCSPDATVECFQSKVISLPAERE